MLVGIIGLGFVGGAMYEVFKSKNINVIGYDKFKQVDYNCNKKDLLDCKILFLCLPTQYNENTGKYDLIPILETMEFLRENNYNGSIVIKSTVEPGVSEELDMKYNLNIIHNPEFLTARTARQDFENQSHIVLGKSLNCSEESYNNVIKFYKKLWSNAKISTCTSTESETMKICCNTFYAMKVQYFTELYLMCKKQNMDYNVVKQMMLDNNWINPMHTTVPGPDGNISYGGLCFPKDTNALMHHMKRNNLPHGVIESTILERNSMRKDNDNIQKN